MTAESARGLVLDIRNPPQGLPYRELEDFLNREVLKANGIGLSEGELMVALDHPTRVLQAAAAHVLGASGSRDARDRLIQLMGSDDDLVQVEAAYALARLGFHSGIDGLLGCLKLSLEGNFTPPIAAGYLARLGDPCGFQTIVRSLDSRFPDIRMIACKQLYFFVPWQGKIDPFGSNMDVYREFGRALQDPSTDVVWQALVQLRETHPAELRANVEYIVATATQQQILELAMAILKHMDAAGAAPERNTPPKRSG